VTTSAEGVVEGLQGSGLQIDIAEIVAHEANDPNPVIGLFDADPLPGECGREVDFLATNADTGSEQLRRSSPFVRMSPSTACRLRVVWAELPH